MITKRDAQVINFISDYKVARTSTIASLFYTSYQVAARRLVALVSSGELQRERDGWSAEYVYYIKKPKQIRHALTVTDFYCALSKQTKIAKFIIEPKLGNVRPDAVVGFSVNGINRLALLEVELSNKGFDSAKYARFDWQKYFPVRPELFIITTHKPPTIADYNSMVINTDLRFTI